MGCDIHFYIEKKVKNKWVCTDKIIPNIDYDEDDPHDLDYELCSKYIGRSYSLFGILADVRNYDFNYISLPKGLPNDVSKEIKEWSDRWGNDGHSHSWFTLKELLDFNWTQTNTMSGILNIVEFDKWNKWDRKNGEGPNSYCRGVGGGNTKIISEEEMLDKIKKFNEDNKSNLNYQTYEKLLREKLGNYYCECSWKIKYYQEVSYFLSTIIPEMLHMSKGKYENVRCIFWFDS